MTLSWKPMGTAPKDGTRVLGLIERAEWDVGIDTVSPRWSDEPFAAEMFWDSRFGWHLVEAFEAYGARLEVSHWSSLPKRRAA